jgi:hypothetical protein
MGVTSLASGASCQHGAFALPFHPGDSCNFRVEPYANLRAATTFANPVVRAALEQNSAVEKRA